MSPLTIKSMQSFWCVFVKRRDYTHILCTTLVFCDFCMFDCSMFDCSTFDSSSTAVCSMPQKAHNNKQQVKPIARNCCIDTERLRLLLLLLNCTKKRATSTLHCGPLEANHRTLEPIATLGPFEDMLGHFCCKDQGLQLLETEAG